MPLTAEQTAAIARVLDADGVDDRAALGLEGAATEASIRKAYLRIALLLHPDKCGADPRATAAFKKLQHRRDAALKAISFGGSEFGASASTRHQQQRRRPPPNAHRQPSPPVSSDDNDSGEDNSDSDAGYFDQAFHGDMGGPPPGHADANNHTRAADDDYASRFQEAFRANEEAAAWRRAAAAQERAEQARREAKGAFTSGFGAAPPRPKPHARTAFFGKPPFPPKQTDGTTRWFAADADKQPDPTEHPDPRRGHQQQQSSSTGRAKGGRGARGGGGYKPPGSARASGGWGGPSRPSFGGAERAESDDANSKAWSFRPDFSSGVTGWADRFGQPKRPAGFGGAAADDAASSSAVPDFTEPEAAGTSWDADATAAAAARRTQRRPAFEGDNASSAGPGTGWRSGSNKKPRFDFGFGASASGGSPPFGDSEPPPTFTRVPTFAASQPASADGQPPRPFDKPNPADPKPFFAARPEGDAPRDHFGFKNGPDVDGGAAEAPSSSASWQHGTSHGAWWETASWSHAKGFTTG